VYGAFADVRHTNGLVNVSAQTAKDALGEVKAGGSLVVRILVQDGSSRANGRSVAGISPILPVDLWFAASSTGDFRRSLRILSCDDSGLEALTKGFKHNQRSVPE
jgi:hypothetical protein